MSDDYLDEYIDETLAYLGDAVDRNFERWGDSFNNDELLTPKERNLHSHEEAVAQLKSFISTRAVFG